MFDHLNVVATAVFLFFFALVTVLGFVASRWRAGDLDHIQEWGLGGRRFGPWVTWFLLGGDLYTAYTVIAIPAVVYAIGAYGFFAVPYTIVIYPFLYLTMPRLWAVSHRRGYMTASDFVLGRYGNRWLELAVALTGILATMPYIALQLGRSREGDRRARLSEHRLHGACADHDRIRDSCALHLQERTAGAGDDRLRQRCDDLCLRHRGRHRHPLPAWRLRPDLRRGARGLCGQDRRQLCVDGGRYPGAETDRALHHASPLARRWRYSCTRTPLRARWPRPAGEPSGATQ